MTMASLLEMVLPRAVGDEEYKRYLIAKKHKFYASAPPAPHVSRDRLLLARFIVGGFRSLSGGHFSIAETVMTPSGQQKVVWVPIPVPKDQKVALEYFNTWYENIKKALARPEDRNREASR
ncbi:hypothetical protein CWRG_01093 [Chthonomonas calidirosea]|nr:hypothetical protein CWRG_01093 [Chthonomonas calidirosea]